MPGAAVVGHGIVVPVAVIVRGHRDVADGAAGPDAFEVGAVVVVEVPGWAALQGEIIVAVAIVVGGGGNAAGAGARPDIGPQRRGEERGKPESETKHGGTDLRNARLNHQEFPPGRDEEYSGSISASLASNRVR